MEVKNRVCAVALTDSAHNIWLQETSKGTRDWMHQVKKNNLQYTCVNTQAHRKTKIQQIVQKSIPYLSSHHVTYPSNELRSLCVCSSLILPCTILLTYTGAPGQQQALEVIVNHRLHVFLLFVFFNQRPLFLSGCMSMKS